MAFLKRGNRFHVVGLTMLVVVLVTAAFLPILPDSACGPRINYATLLKNEWNKRQQKKSDVQKSAETSAPVAKCNK